MTCIFSKICWKKPPFTSQKSVPSTRRASTAKFTAENTYCLCAFSFLSASLSSHAPHYYHLGTFVIVSCQLNACFAHKQSCILLKFIRSCRQVCPLPAKEKEKGSLQLTCLEWPMRLPWISRRGGCRSPGRIGCRRRLGRPTDGTSGGCPGTARPCACCGGVQPSFRVKMRADCLRFCFACRNFEEGSFHR